MVRSKTEKRQSWDNYFFHGPWPLKWLIHTTFSKAGPLSSIEKYLEVADKIRHQIDLAAEEDERFRAFGAAWSLSPIAHQQDRMHGNLGLNLKWAVPRSMVDQASPFDHQELFFFQCGNRIKEVSNFIRTRGRSLSVSGASNGQTLAGAISTGMTGSFIDQGGIQDLVVGLNLIIGPDPEDVVYIERASAPAMNSNFSKLIKSRLIRSDEIFNAALVGLGAFGFIHGIVLKTVDQFLLKRYTQRIDEETALQLAEQLNFKQTNIQLEEEVDQEGKWLRPYYFMSYINPYKGEVVAELLYKKKYRSRYRSPISQVKRFLYKELTSWIGTYAKRFNIGLAGLMKHLKSGVFHELDEEAEGTLADLFWDNSYRDKAFAVALGIEPKNIKAAYEILKKLMREQGPIPALIGLRHAKGTEATLGFTRFKRTCILEFAGVKWEASDGLIALRDFLDLLLTELQQQKIPFTHHWGKNTNWEHPQLAQYMYGEDRIERWKAAREALLPGDMLYVFENEFLDQLDLSGPTTRFKDLVAELQASIKLQVY